MADKETIEFAIKIKSLPKKALDSPLADLIMMKEINGALVSEYYNLDEIIILFINNDSDTIPNARKLVLELAIKSFKVSMLNCITNNNKIDEEICRRKIEFLKTLLEKEQQ